MKKNPRSPAPCLKEFRGFEPFSGFSPWYFVVLGKMTPQMQGNKGILAFGMIWVNQIDDICIFVYIYIYILITKKKHFLVSS